MIMPILRDFTEAPAINIQSRGDTYLKKGYGDVWRERPPFHAPSATLQDPHFNIFLFHKTSILTKNHKISPFSVQNALNLVTFQFLCLKTNQTLVQEASFGPKITKQHFFQKKKKKEKEKKKSVQQAFKFGANPFCKPPPPEFSALWVAPPYPNQSWVPPLACNTCSNVVSSVRMQCYIYWNLLIWSV